MSIPSNSVPRRKRPANPPSPSTRTSDGLTTNGKGLLQDLFRNLQKGDKNGTQAITLACQRDDRTNFSAANVLSGLFDQPEKSYSVALTSCILTLVGGSAFNQDALRDDIGGTPIAVERVLVADQLLHVERLNGNATDAFCEAMSEAMNMGALKRPPLISDLRLMGVNGLVLTTGTACATDLFPTTAYVILEEITLLHHDSPEELKLLITRLRDKGSSLYPFAVTLSLALDAVTALNPKPELVPA